MLIEWGNNNAKLTIIATDSYDKLFLSIIEKQVCDRGVYVSAIKGRVEDAQKKMHEKSGAIVDLRARLHSKSIMSRIRRLFGL